MQNLAIKVIVLYNEPMKLYNNRRSDNIKKTRGFEPRVCKKAVLFV